MRSLFQVLTVFVVCFVTMALPVAPAQAADGEAYITLDPENGVPGTPVIVRGYNFTAGELVDIYYYLNDTRTLVMKDVQVLGTRRFTTTFAIPESYKGPHEVLADGANNSASLDFTVEPGLTVSPEQGPVGTSVTVQGRGFAKNEARIEVSYYLNSTNPRAIPGNMTANALGSWQTSFKIPVSAMGNHKIDAKGNSSTLFAVQDAFFEVTPGISLDKSSGTVGENITMTGSGFYADDRYITILFADKEVNSQTRVDADHEGYWVKAFEVPAMPKGTYNVTAYGEETLKKDIRALSFGIQPGLVLSPDEGHVGMELSLAGGGFAADKGVVIMYDGNETATATTNSSGSFSVVFPVPASQHGARRVTAADAAGNNATAIFTMESVPPPLPELKSPSDGSRVGFIGKVRPTFNWSAVFDESDVYYNLQIATVANVTTDGFANFTVLVPRIVGTNYTLNATQALPYGTYYWIVQAVDKAGNVGNWTVAYSFHAGVLPLWAFVLIVVVAVAVIGTLVYFFIIRKRTYYY